jgi:hypothetical protein
MNSTIPCLTALNTALYTPISLNSDLWRVDICSHRQHRTASAWPCINFRLYIFLIAGTASIIWFRLFSHIIWLSIIQNLLTKNLQSLPSHYQQLVRCCEVHITYQNGISALIRENNVVTIRNWKLLNLRLTSHHVWWYTSFNNVPSISWSLIRPLNVPMAVARGKWMRYPDTYNRIMPHWRMWKEEPNCLS